MKEHDTSCEFAVDIKNAPRVQELIDTNRVRLDESQIICQLLLPYFSDKDASYINPMFPNIGKTTYLNGEEITNLKFVGCHGKTSKQCPHPDSIFKVSQREEYKQLRSKAFKNYKPI